MTDDSILAQDPARARAASPAAEPPLLEVSDLQTRFFTLDGVVRAVDGVSLTIHRGETLAVVGESGCGKSVTALSILQLLPPQLGRVVGGSIRFDGQELLAFDESAMRQIRGNRISMIFQEPMTSLNPVHTVGDQIAEAVLLHEKTTKREAMHRAAEMLKLVRIPEPERRLKDYPHQFSGGMRQRVMIAMALACSPELLIADEPTTALDVTVQAQILRLILDLKERVGAAVMLITHDLGVVAETAQRVIVMYAGRKVEEAPVLELFDRPMHPYTRGLMASIPRGRIGAGTGGGKRLQEIPGIVPSLSGPIVGCAFAPRCSFATDRCRQEAPDLFQRDDAHWAACFEIDRVLAA